MQWSADFWGSLGRRLTLNKVVDRAWLELATGRYHSKSEGAALRGAVLAHSGARDADGRLFCWTPLSAARASLVDDADAVRVKHQPSPRCLTDGIGSSGPRQVEK